jgi:hypothetical protein
MPVVRGGESGLSCIPHCGVSLVLVTVFGLRCPNIRFCQSPEWHCA